MNQLIVISSLGVLVIISLYIVFRFLKKNLFFNHRFVTPFAKYFYNYLHSHRAIKDIRVSNYGFAPVDEELAIYDTDHRYGLQLYKELIKNHHGFLVNETSSLVEVGCGKGAGAEFLIKKFGPASYTGIDYSEKAIAYCKENYTALQNIDFICADAHRLPLLDHSADIVINVESSHIYKDIDCFFKEVYRVLKPGGKFLITDYRIQKRFSIDSLEATLTGNGFEIDEKRNITNQVLEACCQASERRKSIIDKHCPWFFKKYFRHYAILKGTKKSKMMADGQIIYFIYHLIKK
jgi:ubiquinone/menaquinone biosynthesis C-methylase UbiE